MTETAEVAAMTALAYSFITVLIFVLAVQYAGQQGPDCRRERRNAARLALLAWAWPALVVVGVLLVVGTSVRDAWRWAEWLRP